MTRVKILSIIIASFVILVPTQPLWADEEFEPDFPENHIPMMKYWLSKQTLKSTMDEFSRIFDILPPEERERLANIPSVNLYSWNSFETQWRREKVYALIGVMEKIYRAYDHLLNEEFALVLGDADDISTVTAKIIEEGISYLIFVDSAFSEEPVTGRVLC